MSTLSSIAVVVEMRSGGGGEKGELTKGKEKRKRLGLTCHL